MAKTNQQAAAQFYRRESLQACILRACTNCGAGAEYHDVKGVNVGCYDPDRKGQYVGPICPNCGAKRPENEALGEIWAREYRQKLWPVLKATVWDAAKLLKRRTRR